MELNLLPNCLFMFWFNSFCKFEASVFFVGGGKGRVGGEEGQRLEWRSSGVNSSELPGKFKPGEKCI